MAAVRVIFEGMRWATVVFALIIQPARCRIPQPVSIGYTADHYRLPLEIGVSHNAPFCFVLHAAIKRLLANFRLKHPVVDRPIAFNGTITQIDIEVTRPCDELVNKEYPTESSVELCMRNL